MKKAGSVLWGIVLIVAGVIWAGFEKLDDAEWYANMLAKNPELQNTFASMGVQVICITETNIALLGQQLSWQDYLEWQKQ